MLFANPALLSKSRDAFQQSKATSVDLLFVPNAGRVESSNASTLKLAFFEATILLFAARAF